jgi:hypothetical protein
VALLALWSMAVLPLVALPVDWEEVCGCDACPFAGGPTCCCRQFPSWPNADGSPGNRAVIGQPHAISGADRCLESMVAPQAVKKLAEPGRHSRFIRPHRQARSFIRKTPNRFVRKVAVPTLLPRPPPESSST